MHNALSHIKKSDSTDPVALNNIVSNKCNNHHIFADIIAETYESPCMVLNSVTSILVTEFRTKYTCDRIQNHTGRFAYTQDQFCGAMSHNGRNVVQFFVLPVSKH